MTEGNQPSPGDRVLLLPATRRDGEAICAFLERESIHCTVCTNAREVATGIDGGAATVVLTDSALADPQGRHIVDALERQPPWSDIPVVLLGKPRASFDVELLIGRLTNVTVLERPTSSRSLISAIHTSLRARARQYQMRDQMMALVEAENALRQADRRKDEFLAMLAHELRNPLAPIRTASDVLPRLVPSGDERVDATLKVVRRQVLQLSRLVDDLLDVSRITHGRIELQQEVLDIASVVAQALEAVEPSIQEKSQVVMRQAHLPSLYVKGDRARLVQCVSNILTNASKYSDAGGRIQVSLRAESGCAVITVEDNGIGMSAELLPKIFDLFVQSERSLDRSQGGLGIGLSVVRRLVEMHGGTVAARSEGAGRGSAFDMRLPLALAPTEVQPAKEVKSGGGKRVLIVDDNRDAADSLALLLRIHGHDVKTAYSGEEALGTADAFIPELVLLDIGLPGMNGYDAARELRQRGVHATLIALTGYGQPDDVRRARDAGFDAHMVKPVDFDRVLASLNA